MAGPSNLGAAEASEDAAGILVLAAAEAVSAGSQLLSHHNILIKSFFYHMVGAYVVSAMSSVKFTQL